MILQSYFHGEWLCFIFTVITAYDIYAFFNWYINWMKVAKTFPSVLNQLKCKLMIPNHNHLAPHSVKLNLTGINKCIFVWHQTELNNWTQWVCDLIIPESAIVNKTKITGLNWWSLSLTISEATKFCVEYIDYTIEYLWSGNHLR